MYPDTCSWATIICRECPICQKLDQRQVKYLTAPFTAATPRHFESRSGPPEPHELICWAFVRTKYSNLVSYFNRDAANSHGGSNGMLEFGKNFSVAIFWKWVRKWIFSALQKWFTRFRLLVQLFGNWAGLIHFLTKVLEINGWKPQSRRESSFLVKNIIASNPTWNSHGG